MHKQLSKFKRLLTLSRQRLEENQKALAEKDGALSRLSKEGDALRARVSQLQQQVQQAQAQQQQGNGGVSTKTARRALLRVDVGARVWLLLEPEEGPGAAAVVGREGEGDYWQAFRYVRARAWVMGSLLFFAYICPLTRIHRLPKPPNTETAPRPTPPPSYPPRAGHPYPPGPSRPYPRASPRSSPRACRRRRGRAWRRRKRS